MQNDTVTTSQALDILRAVSPSLSLRRIQAMIGSGVLVGEKIGRDWQISRASVEAELERRRENPELARGGKPAHRGER